MKRLNSLVMLLFFLGACVSEEEQLPTDKKLISFKTGNVSSLLKLEEHAKSFVYYNYYEGKLEASVVQKHTDEGFGTIADKLSLGDHDLYFIAHNTGECHLDYGTKQLSFDKILDTFIYHTKINVTEETPVNLDINLHRCVSLVEIVPTDEIPENVKSIRLTVTGYCDKLNVNTEIGLSETVDLMRDLVIPSNFVGEKNVPFKLYCFVPDGKPNFTLKAEALDAEKKVLFSHVFENVPIKKNVDLKYTGVFFKNTQKGVFKVSIDPLWEDTKIIDF